MPVTNVKTDWTDGNLNFRDKDGNIIATWDGTNRKLTFPSGSTLEALGTVTIVDGAVAAGDIALATGSMFLGTAGKAAALDVKADGAILIGNGSTAAMQTLDTDVTMTNTGAVTIANNAITAAKINADAVTTAKILDGNVTSAKLANGAGWAALLAAGLGASANYIKTTDGVQTLATGTAGAKTCLFVVTVTEAFVTDGGNTQPTFAFGEVGTAAKFAATTLLDNAALGAVKVFSGSLTASTNVIVTAAQAVGTGTGAISVMVMILPSAV